MQKPDWEIITVLCIKWMIQIKLRKQVTDTVCSWGHVTGVIRAFFQCGPAALLIIQTQRWLDSKTSQQWVLPAAQTSPLCLFVEPCFWAREFLHRLSLNFEVVSNHSFCVHGTSPRLGDLTTVLPVVAVPSVASLLFVWIHNVLYGSGCFGARVLDLTDPWRCCPILST